MTSATVLQRVNRIGVLHRQIIGPELAHDDSGGCCSSLPTPGTAAWSNFVGYAW